MSAAQGTALGITILCIVYVSVYVCIASGRQRSLYPPRFVYELLMLLAFFPLVIAMWALMHRLERPTLPTFLNPKHYIKVCPYCGTRCEFVRRKIQTAVSAETWHYENVIRCSHCGHPVDEDGRPVPDPS